MPGTSVRSCAPWRLAIRRVTFSEYSSSSLVPRIACSTTLTAAITSAARSASPNEPTWMSSGQHLVGDHSSERVGDQDEQEARDEHERQAQRGQHGRQHRVEHGDERRDEERGAGAARARPRAPSRPRPRSRPRATTHEITSRSGRRRGVAGCQLTSLAVRRCAGVTGCSSATAAVDPREALLVGGAELLQRAAQLGLGLAERCALADAPGDALHLRREGLGRVLDLLAPVGGEVALGVLDLRQVAADGLEAALHPVDGHRGRREALELVDLLADVRARVADRALGLVLLGLAAGADREAGEEREDYERDRELHGYRRPSCSAVPRTAEAEVACR